MAEKYVLAKRLGILALLCCLVVSCVILYFCWYNPQTTVIVLRHAEKVDPSNLPDDEVPLTDDGTNRANNLAQVLERAGVTAIYVTEKLRTQRTAEPLATSRGITPTIINEANTDELINQVLARGNRGGVIVIVGHSNTVPVIVERLGGGTVTVGGNQFDNLFVLTLRAWNPARLIQATYGEPRVCPVCP